MKNNKQKRTKRNIKKKGEGINFSCSKNDVCEVVQPTQTSQEVPERSSLSKRERTTVRQEKIREREEQRRKIANVIDESRQSRTNIHQQATNVRQAVRGNTTGSREKRATLTQLHATTALKKEELKGISESKREKITNIKKGFVGGKKSLKKRTRRKR